MFKLNWLGFGKISLTAGISVLLSSICATPSQAATCTFQQITSAGGCTLTDGTKSATNITASNFFVTPFIGRGWNANDTVSLTKSGSIWSFVFDFTPQGSVQAATILASLTLTNTDPGTVFDTISISRTGSTGIGGLVAGSQAIFSDGPTISTANILGLTGPSSATFTDNVSSTDINFRFLALTGTLNTTTVTLTERVPTPLPIMGAGIGFAWSRKLRRRITQNQ